MKILFIHNRYVRLSGEEAVVARESELLRQRGHSVELFFVSNEDIHVASPLDALRVGANTVWSPGGYSAVSDAIQRFEPDLVHIHNFFPQLSPSVYWAAKRQHKPVVQTLHNYRLLCANGLLMRDGRPCELCVGRLPVPAMQYRCYRDSIAATLPLVSMQVAHRMLGSFNKKVDAYIALTEFSKQLFIRGGLPAERVHVKPNFVPDVSGPGPLDAPRPRQIAFVGRIAPEKGLGLLLDSWRRTSAAGWRLLIVGDGPQREELQQRYRDCTDVAWAGWLSHEEVLAALAQSRFQVVTSKWYEGGFPLVSVESLAMGTPVIGPGWGTFPEIIRPGQNGLLFDVDNPESLPAMLERATALSDAEQAAMRAAARSTYLQRYTAGPNYDRLMDIYEKAAQSSRAARPAKAD